MEVLQLFRSRIIGVKSAATLFAMVAILITAGCANDSPDNRSSVAGTTTSSAVEYFKPSFDDIPGQYPNPQQVSSPVEVGYPVGTCVKVYGSRSHTEISAAECGSLESNYRIIQRASDPRQCVSDADRLYYHNGKDGEWAACLDYAWTPESCISITASSVERTDCDDPKAPDKVKPIRVIVGVTDVSSCRSGGYAHPVRRFTVCTQMQK
ncbi:Uncharacterised protein [Mycobacteroides abscessus subsp. massiliense]|nr:Uncharacterised protein [Mycobacteroides abscessus subsp. massiliense]